MDELSSKADSVKQKLELKVKEMSDLQDDFDRRRDTTVNVSTFMVLSIVNSLLVR